MGTVLFTARSVFFLSEVGWINAGAWRFIIGSLLFGAGATFNALQIVQAKGMVTLQLLKLTALSLVTGAIPFTVASIPYLWHVDTRPDRRPVDPFLAWQYLAGSMLFLLGGCFNYWRACLVIRRQIAEAASKPGP